MNNQPSGGVVPTENSLLVNENGLNANDASGQSMGIGMASAERNPPRDRTELASG